MGRAKKEIDIEKACALLCDQNLRVADIAAEFDMGVSFFSALFTRHAGMPPGRYRRSLKEPAQHNTAEFK